MTVAIVSLSYLVQLCATSPMLATLFRQFALKIMTVVLDFALVLRIRLGANELARVFRFPNAVLQVTTVAIA